MAVDGKDGFEKYLDFYKEHNKYFDLVLSDIKMPNMNGIELIKTIYKENLNQKVLVLSAHNESEYLMQLINLGIRQFILKPLDYNNFLDVVFKINKDIYFEKNKEKTSDLIKLSDTLIWNKKNQELIDNNKVIKLTKKELILISLLLKYPEKTHNNDEIISLMWADEFDKNPDISNLKNIISRLRKKVPSLNIENIYSFGYKIHILLD
ncbi:MAG: response regulator [Aliarcobacter sp.]|nr:response regulator [Aliarcobacter sp.]